MSLFNCMYGAAHPGDQVAVRNKVGHTVGWLCARHFQQHEKTLIQNGYHFRTPAELRARGELGTRTPQGDNADMPLADPWEGESFDQETTAGGGGTHLAAVSAQEQQLSRHDDSRGDSDAAELAHGSPVRDYARGRPHGSPADGPAASGGGRPAGRPLQAAQEIVEARPAGAQTEERGLTRATPATRDAGQLDWPAWTQGAGYLTLTEEQREILQRPFDDQDITIRYDGVVYVPWRKYWSRMVKAFRPFIPSIIPIDNPRFQGQEIIVGVVMAVEGKFIGKAWGSHRLEGANDRMAVGDRIESAISDALSKIGKRLDMGEALWDERFRDYWKANYAESYTNRGRTSWRRKVVSTIEEHENDLPDYGGDVKGI